MVAAIGATATGVVTVVGAAAFGGVTAGADGGGTATVVVAGEAFAAVRGAVLAFGLVEKRSRTKLSLVATPGFALSSWRALS